MGIRDFPTKVNSISTLFDYIEVLEERLQLVEHHIRNFQRPPSEQAPYPTLNFAAVEIIRGKVKIHGVGATWESALSNAINKTLNIVHCYEISNKAFRLVREGQTKGFYLSNSNVIRSRK